MPRLYLDFETYSEIPIKNGTHAYAEEVELIVLAYAVDNGQVEVHDLTLDPDGQWGPEIAGLLPYLPPAFTDLLRDPATICVAHNSHFDRTMLRKVWGDLCPPIERWRDTMARAQAHSLPGGLGILSEIYKLTEDKAKDKKGKDLIRLFCMPRPANHTLRRATRETHPAEWAEFLEYAKLDIEAMRELDKKLPQWNYNGRELKRWFLDQKINDRGFAVDVELAEKAVEAIAIEKIRLKQATIDNTGGALTSTTQRDKFMEYALAAYDIALPDTKKYTLQLLLDQGELPDELAELVRIRLMDAAAAATKYKSLLKSVSPDGRLRNTIKYCGAGRTGRSAGQIFQPQNLMRPTLSKRTIEAGIQCIKGGAPELITDNVMGLCGNAIRGCIVASPGKKLVIADLSNIEGRCQAWLAKEEWKLQAFRDYDAGTGPDLYKLAYARAFGIDPKDVTDFQRQIGKTMELALGYQGGVGAFVTFATAFGIDLEALAKIVLPTIHPNVYGKARALAVTAMQRRKLMGLSLDAYTACEALKIMWRDAHPEISAMWHDLEDTARRAIQLAGRMQYTAGGHAMIYEHGWLRAILPSGRSLSYASPAVSENGKITFTGVHPFSKQFTRLSTYGGKLFENYNQAMGADVFHEHGEEIEAAGYELELPAHDEWVAEVPDTDEYSAGRLAEMMSVVPDWAPGLPLAAAGFETYRYRKG